MKKFSLVNQTELDKINKNNIKGLAPDRQIKAIRMWVDQNIKKYGPQGTKDTDEEMQTFIAEMAAYLGLYVDSVLFQTELKKQKGWGTAAVKEGTLAKVTDACFDALPEELQKRLETALSNSAPPQGGQGVKSLTGTPKYKGVSYTYELKFLGAFGNHRCYGNKVGQKVVFDVYDPNGTLH